MRHDVSQVLLAGKTRELASNRLLPTARKHLCGVSEASSTGLGFIVLDEEVFVGVSIGHDG